MAASLRHAGFRRGPYLAVTVLAAWIFYRYVGLALLRKAWLNLDWLWAGALVVTGAVVLLK